MALKNFFGMVCLSALVWKSHNDVKTKCTPLKVWMNCVDNCGMLMDMMLFVLAEICKNDARGTYCQQLCQCTGKLPWQLDWIQAQVSRTLLNPHIVSREAEWHFLGCSSRKPRERKRLPPSWLLCITHPQWSYFWKTQRPDSPKDLVSLWLDSDPQASIGGISCVTRGRKGLSKSAIFKWVHHGHWLDCLSVGRQLDCCGCHEERDEGFHCMLIWGD